MDILMSESSYGFQAAFEANATLQNERHAALQSSLVRIEGKVDAVSLRQDRTDEVLAGLERIISLFSKKNLAFVGGAFGAISTIATMVARLVS